MTAACKEAVQARLRELLSPHIWLCIAEMLAALTVIYYGSRQLLPYLPVYRLDLKLDAAIPFIPEWVSVYCLAYASWAVSAIIILAQGKAHARRFTAAFITATVLSGVLFLAWPLTMDQPEIEGKGLLRDLLRFIYQVDQPNNLFPSLHVLASYFCWRGLWGCSRIPKWFKCFNLLFLILVSLSTVFVKQHLSIDIPGGILVGEATLQAVRLFGKAKNGQA